MEIPVYLIAGFLEGGKTNFINGILEDGFAREDSTLLICCEEGIEEYNPRFLQNVTVVTIEDESELSRNKLKQLEQKYQPKQILIEYNGMWEIQKLYFDYLPQNWLLYQIMTFVDATTFNVYVKNMGSLMMEKLKDADMIVFNRCTAESRKALRDRNLKMVNRRADIYLENMDGSSEEYADETVSAFDLSAPVIEIRDDDYGIFYVEAMDLPQRFDGKTVRFKAQMCKSPQFAEGCVPGRFAMVCCANDIAFLGMACKASGLETFQNRDWVMVTATLKAEHLEAYGEDPGPVLYATAIEPAEPAKEEVIQF